MTADEMLSQLRLIALTGDDLTMRQTMTLIDAFTIISSQPDLIESIKDVLNK